MRHVKSRCHVKSRWLIALLFLLQCLAPLLHAHTHAAEHGGIHLPGWGGTHAHGHGDVALQVDEEAAVGLLPSLEPRADAGLGLLETGAHSPWRLSAQGACVLAPHPTHHLPGQPPHLIPLPGPPPTL
ncbi:MAG: hypothetical protein N2Z63_02260 [Thiobacillaceae bacterium]|nr:hypothetical protein [Thiobacillaceae bacterium]MDW8323632.1 hypothetical protein [Burkholderiales bacterium]